MQEAVSIRCILPQRFLYVLKALSSMEPFAYRSFNQLSVSRHSLRAILNFESISGKLCGYCASVMLAKTLEDDLQIWNIVFLLSCFSKVLHKRLISTANCSEKLSRGLSFTFSPLTAAYHLNQGEALYVINTNVACNPPKVVCNPSETLRAKA